MKYEIIAIFNVKCYKIYIRWRSWWWWKRRFSKK